MRESEKFHFRCQQGMELFKIKRSIITNRQKSKTRTFAFRQQLPWHQVAMVFHHRQQDHVSFANEFSTPCLGHQVDAFSRAARENNFVGTCCADVLRDALPRALVSFCRARTQRVQAAMYICVVVLVKIPQRLDDSARFLRARSAIEVNQRMPSYLLTQDREILANS